MPLANFKLVREVSSEDSVHTAANILRQQPGKKWKTKSVGDKSAHIVLELDIAQQIVGLDIGNEHSAFIEVMVSKSGCSPNDFTDLLITCSFMTPFESKNSENINRVRCFGKEALVNEATKEKWTLVKVICTQPFNKHVQYGLSFLKLHVANENEKNFKTTTNSTIDQCLVKPLVPKKFLLREESPDSDTESTSALFNRWKTQKITDNDKQTAAASIRQASKSIEKLKNLTKNDAGKNVKTNKCETSINDKTDLEVRDRNRDELFYEKIDYQVEDKKLAKLESCIEDDKNRLVKKMSINSNTKKSGHDSNEKKVCKKRISMSPNKEPSKKTKVSPPKQYRPFNYLLRDVVIVISGIQNPQRAELRSKALAMGAKYRTDWERGCTHLICAFKNTPKYNSVVGKGKIVSPKWIEKCFEEKKYLPWRRYALETTEAAKLESDEEILDEVWKLDTKHTENGSTLTFQDAAQSSTINEDTLSGTDTDDEIQRAEKQNQKNQKTVFQSKPTEPDVYEVTTEEETYITEKLKLHSKKNANFFNKTKFFVCEDVSVVDKAKVQDLILKFSGQLTDNVEDADYILTENPTKTIENARFRGEAVLPMWIYECNGMERKLPTARYLVKIEK